jgi:CubicO group peptidase (beta-lactamase class C family)
MLMKLLQVSKVLIASLLLPLVLMSGSVIADEASTKKVIGHWEGSIELPNQALKFDVDFKLSGESLTGDISIPAQGATDLPLIAISIEGAKISFQIQGVPGEPTFNGQISDKAITGSFIQGGQTLKFSMNQGDNLAAKAKESLADFDDVVNQALKDFNTPGVAIGVLVDNKVVLAKGYGMRDIAAKKPVTENTLFAIGSTTKAMTAAMIGSLVAEGKLEWHKPVISYMPDFRLQDLHATHNLTVNDLLTHKSGLPRHDFLWYNSSLSSKELFSRFHALEPTADLRERYQYQNLMYMTAGLLAETVTGKNWREVMAERLFKPLAMNHTNFSVESSKQTGDYALPYREDDGELINIPFRNIDQIGPAGSVNSSVNEMLNWLQLNINEGKFNDQQVLSKQLVQTLHSPQTIVSGYPTSKDSFLATYGMGWIINAYHGHYQVSHGGAIDGFIASVAHMPLDKIAVVVFANKSGAALPSLLTTEIFDRILGIDNNNRLANAVINRQQALEMAKTGKEKLDETRIKGTKPSHKLKAFVGRYNHPGYGVVTVTQEKKSLVAEYNNIKTILKHWHYNVFNANGYEDDPTLEDTKFQFRLDIDGKVAELLVPLESSLPAIAFSKLPDNKLIDPKYLERFVGKYALPGQQVTIALQGNRLTASLPGQPLYTLEPKQGSLFQLKDLPGFMAEFIIEDSKVKGMKFIQPNGVFEASRVED